MPDKFKPDDLVALKSDTDLCMTVIKKNPDGTYKCCHNIQNIWSKVNRSVEYNYKEDLLQPYEIPPKRFYA